MILMIGTSLATRGGVATVVQSYIDAGFFKEQDIEYLATHSDGSGLKKLAVALVGLFRFWLKLPLKKYNIVHVHSASRASFYRKTIFIISAKLFNKPVVFHLHGAEFRQFYERELSSLGRWFARSLLLKCDAIIVLSSQWKQWIENSLGSGDVHVLHNTLPVGELTRPRQLSEKHNIVFLGRVGERKGVGDLINACELLLQKNYFSLSIAGDGDVEKYQSMVEQKGLSAHIRFLGWVDLKTKQRLLDEADILTLPSYNEGLPMSVLEALTNGIPVVATPVGGIPDVLEDAENGFIVDPGDAEALANSFDKLLSNSDTYRAMSEYALESMRAKFSMAHTKKALLEIYKFVLDKEV